MLRFKEVLCCTSLFMGLSYMAMANNLTVPKNESCTDNKSGTVLLVVNDKELGPLGTTLKDVTMVPIRSVIEAMGGQVIWNKNDKNLTAIVKDKIAKFTIGSREVDINGRHILIRESPCFVNGTICVPLRFFVDSMGSRLDWSSSPKIAYIYSDNFDYVGDRLTKDIRSIHFTPKKSVHTGDELNVEILAPPSSRVIATIEGLNISIPTYEDRAGRYLGTLKITEDMSAKSAHIISKVIYDGKEMSKTSTDIIDINEIPKGTANSVKISTYPQTNEFIKIKRPQIKISDSNGTLIPSSARIFIDGKEYSHQLMHISNSFTWRSSSDMDYGKHNVKFLAKNSEGKEVRLNWYFTIVSNRQEDYKNSWSLPLTVTSPCDKDEVSQIFYIAGRTAPSTELTVSISSKEDSDYYLNGKPKKYYKTLNAVSDLTGKFEILADVSSVQASQILVVTVHSQRDNYNSDPIKFEIVKR